MNLFVKNINMPESSTTFLIYDSTGFDLYSKYLNSYVSILYLSQLYPYSYNEMHVKVSSVFLSNIKYVDDENS